MTSPQRSRALLAALAGEPRLTDATFPERRAARVAPPSSTAPRRRRRWCRSSPAPTTSRSASASARPASTTVRRSSRSGSRCRHGCTPRRSSAAPCASAGSPWRASRCSAPDGAPLTGLTLRRGPRLRHRARGPAADGVRVAAGRRRSGVPPRPTARVELDRERAQRRHHPLRRSSRAGARTTPPAPSGTSTVDRARRSSAPSCSSPGSTSTARRTSGSVSLGIAATPRNVTGDMVDFLADDVVLLMFLVVGWAPASRSSSMGEPTPSLGALRSRYPGIGFSRVAHDGVVEVANDGHVLAAPATASWSSATRLTVARRSADDVGERSDQHLPLDRSALDFRSVVVSNRRLAGKRRLADLDLGAALRRRPSRGSAVATTTSSPTTTSSSQLGDRVRGRRPGRPTRQGGALPRRLRAPPRRGRRLRVRPRDRCWTGPRRRDVSVAGRRRHRARCRRRPARDRPGARRRLAHRSGHVADPPWRQPGAAPARHPDVPRQRRTGVWHHVRRHASAPGTAPSSPSPAPSSPSGSPRSSRSPPR